MSVRFCVAATFVALAVSSLPAFAQAPAASAAAAAPMPGIPANTCAKPEFPGRLASSMRINAFNKEYAAYRDCTNKYVDTTKKIANDAVAAGNAAVDDFNKFAQEIKAQSDANN